MTPILELHIWGPAFSLPSIDPHCLAAIAYLTQTLPRESWVLIASSDATLSPTKELPILRDGSTWVGGFQNIVSHLSKRSDQEWDLDCDLDGRERGDLVAFSSFIETHGKPLLDLSLYVSSENYISTTRPAYSRLLQWPYPWIIPPQRRALAKARTEHFDLSALDLDHMSSDDSSKSEAAQGFDLIPRSLRNPRQTVTSLIKQSQRASRFRLDALAETFFEPLQQLLGEKRFLLEGGACSSLDCLALGYLALALMPEVPQSWLADTMKGKYPRLCIYVRELVQDFFGGPVDVDEALPSYNSGMTSEPARKRSKSKLPWQEPAARDLTTTASVILKTAISTLPLASHLESSNILLAGSPKPTRQTTTPAILPPLLALGTAITAITGYLLHSGQINMPEHRREEKRRLGDMGEAGAMLAMADFGSQ